MISKQQTHGSRMAKTVGCNPPNAGSIPARASKFIRVAPLNGWQVVLKTMGVVTSARGSIPLPPANFRKMNRTGVPGLIANQSGPLKRSGVRALLLPPVHVSEAPVGCGAADCKPAHQKHRWFDSNLTHHFCLGSPMAEARG